MQGYARELDWLPISTESQWVRHLRRTDARIDGWEVRELATGHEAMLLAPDAVAELLLDLAVAA